MARPPKKDYLLRIIRESKGISKEVLAKKANIPINNIWRAEVGHVLSEKMAFKIAQILEISPDIMFYNMGRLPPDKRKFVMDDPLFFKEVMDEMCGKASKPTKTIEYMGALKNKMSAINPDIDKLLSQIKA